MTKFALFTAPTPALDVSNRLGALTPDSAEGMMGDASAYYESELRAGRWLLVVSCRLTDVAGGTRRDRSARRLGVRPARDSGRPNLRDRNRFVRCALRVRVGSVPKGFSIGCQYATVLIGAALDGLLIPRVGVEVRSRCISSRFDRFDEGDS